MKKFQFLCSNHRRWLSDRPATAINTWSQSYVKCLDLTEEHKYGEAIPHAGAAYETSEIVLDKQRLTTATDILRFTDSGILLTRLLHRVGEIDFAGVVVASAIARIERLLVLGVEKKSALAACSRLLKIEEGLAQREMRSNKHIFATVVPEHIH